MPVVKIKIAYRARKTKNEIIIFRTDLEISRLTVPILFGTTARIYNVRKASRRVFYQETCFRSDVIESMLDIKFLDKEK